MLAHIDIPWRDGHPRRFNGIVVGKYIVGYRIADGVQLDPHCGAVTNWAKTNGYKATWVMPTKSIIMAHETTTLIAGLKWARAH